MGNARHLNFDGNGYVAFHLLGGLPSILGDNLHQRRNRVWIGLDIELHESQHAGDDHSAEKQHHQGAPAEREGHHHVHRASGSLGGTVDEEGPRGHHPLSDIQARNHLNQIIPCLTGAHLT